MLRALALIWQLMWGLPQNVVGAVLYAHLFRRHRHGVFHTAYVTEWSLNSGLSLGAFIFVPRGMSKALVVHEYGHTIQSMLLGPFYVPMIVIPSLVWAGLPACTRFRERRNYSYYRFFCERWANRLARRVTRERPIGWY